MSDLRTAAQQALEALENAEDQLAKPYSTGARCAITALRAALAEPVAWPLAPLTGYYDVGGKRVWLEKDEPFPQPAPPQHPAEPEQEPVATVTSETGADISMSWWHEPALPVGTKLYTAPPQRKPLTVERLRDALVASRIVPPAAVEEPDGYDDGVTLHRIEALHRRLA